jgi:catalase
MQYKPQISGQDGYKLLSGGAMFSRLAFIGLVLLIFVGLVAYVGGWLTPARLTPAKVLAAFQAVNGPHPGFRRNHAKGVCVGGWFESNGDAAALSKADVFEPGRVPVVGRFALAGGMPMQPDARATVRSMALRFLPAGGQEWRTGMNNIPVFPVATVQGFYEQLLAAKPDPATGKPDPAAMQQFLARHPESVRALALIKARPISAGFFDSSFNSLDAFLFVAPGGNITPVRWSTVPAQSSATETPPEADSGNKDFLFADLIRRVHEHALQWHLVITIGQSGDPTNDATVAWPANRRQVDAGTIVIDSVASEDGGACKDINFDPLVLPAGIEASDDPLLSARSAAYSRSFNLRAAEKKPPSAVTVEATKGGGRS